MASCNCWRYPAELVCSLKVRSVPAVHLSQKLSLRGLDSGKPGIAFRPPTRFDIHRLRPVGMKQGPAIPHRAVSSDPCVAESDVRLAISASPLRTSPSRQALLLPESFS